MSVEKNLKLPVMHWIDQNFEVPPPVDVTAEFGKEWRKIKNRIPLGRGARVAVGVGSRGIANLVEIVRAVVDSLKKSGAKPFIIPAMGSHGGATAEGQIRVCPILGSPRKVSLRPCKPQWKSNRWARPMESHSFWTAWPLKPTELFSSIG
jgi:hypothetical protein